MIERSVPDPSPYRPGNTAETPAISSPHNTLRESFLFAAAMSSLLVTLALPAFIIARPAYNRTALSKILKGMTKQQVSTILGPPERINGEHEWEYSRWGNAGWVEVWFDENALVREINDESVFPP